MVLKHLQETVDALALLGASCQQQVLRVASEIYVGRTRAAIKTVEEFCAAGLEGEFSAFNSRFHACSPSLQECHEAYLTRHQSLFVAII